MLAACTKVSPSICIEQTADFPDGQARMIRMDNGRGMCVKVSNYGASLCYVSVPDKDGIAGPVVLGLDSLGHYLGRNPKLGATVGRYANRIKDGRIIIDADTVYVERNNFGNSIHGGVKGFHTRLFNIDSCYVNKDTAAVIFSYVSADGECGFPGELRLKLAYKLTACNELVLEYEATTDKATVLNLTNHAYFNLGGCASDVLDHQFRIYASHITPCDELGIPTGELMNVTGTKYDFREAGTIRRTAEAEGKGYDINFVLDKPEGLGLAAEVADPASGRRLRAYTTEPGMQFYTPHSEMSYLPGRNYGRFWAFCLEMQHFPDSPNHDNFPSTLLRPGQTYRQTTIYRFDIIQH